MKLANTVKALALVGATSLTLIAGSSQADPGYNPNNNNPWLSGPAYQPIRNQAAFRQQLAEFDQRLDNQLQRILNGMESGKVTMREAVSLLREHVAINAMERQYLSDGRLGANELRDLDQRLNQASKHIFIEQHDREQPGPVDRRPDDGRNHR